MTLRRFEQSDIPHLREIHERAQYGFAFPPMAKMETSWVAVDGEKVIGWAGAQLMPEITMMVSPELSPHWKMGIVQILHRPIEVDLAEKGHKKVFANIDPRCPNFFKRLKALNWWKAWPTAWRDIAA